MTSKVLIKIPAVNFNQVGKHGADLVNSPAVCSPQVSSASTSNITLQNTVDPAVQAYQLEQNLRFLKEQHQMMLSALHQELETLRTRNRDLQFQLVFSRGDGKNSPRQTEEAEKSKSPPNSQHQTGVPPPLDENTEKEMAALRLSLNELKLRNSKLEDILDGQRKKIADLSLKVAESNQPSERELSLANQLHETVQLVHRMRRFHEEQRRELAALKGQKFRGPHAEVGETVRNVKHQQCGQPQQLIQSQPPRAVGQGRSQHHHHHQAHQKLQQQPQHFFSRDIQSEGGNPQNNRFPPLPNAQNYWQNNNHRWTAGVENGQRPPVGRPVQSMPSLPAINPGTPNGRRNHHYFRNSGGAHPHREEHPDAARRFRGKNSGARTHPHRNHEEN